MVFTLWKHVYYGLSNYIFQYVATYEVLFYDGFLMQIKAKQIFKMPKDQAEKMVKHHW